MFGPTGYFAMMLLGLIAAATLTQRPPVKGIVMVLRGLCLGIVGTDVQTGQQRFTLGIPELSDGSSLVALAMGLFGVAEVISSINRIKDKRSAEGALKINFRSIVPIGEDWRRSGMPMTRGTGIGAFFGALPGTGGTIASFMAYAVEKKISREPSRFGKGAVEASLRRHPPTTPRRRLPSSRRSPSASRAMR